MSNFTSQQLRFIRRTEASCKAMNDTAKALYRLNQTLESVQAICYPIADAIAASVTAFDDPVVIDNCPHPVMELEMLLERLF